MKNKPTSLSLLTRSILSANLALVGTSVAYAQETASPSAVLEEVQVTSFRRSLEVALELKRNTVNQSESIVAEDIGKMPDLNLAESIQRVPGVAITREGGEGRNITVRGLGPGFTRTTLNGMEVPGSVGGLDSSGGVNRGRDFDFNLFSSEMFNRITINKSGIANIEEGGLASTVELYTRKPLDNPGQIFTVSAQGSYNMDSSEVDPRITAFYSNTFNDDMFGISAGITRSDRTVHQEGAGSVRWTSAYANGRSWVGDDSDVIINGTLNAAANHPEAASDPTQQLDYIWHPRLPRMDSFNRDQTRTGYTLGLQFRPQDDLLLSLDVVGSKLEADVTSFNYQANFRNEQDDISPVNVTLDPSGRYFIAGTFDDVVNRSESRGQFGETDFLQTVFSAEYDLTDNVTIKAMYGNASSEHHEEQYRFNLDTMPHTMSYDYSSNSDVPEMTYSSDILDPTQYRWAGPTFRLDEVDRDNDTFRLDLTADGDMSVVRAGLIWNTRSVVSGEGDPRGTVTPPAPNDALTAELQEVNDTFGDIIGGPSGFPTNWLVADFDAAIDAYNAGTFEIDVLDAQTFNVEEKTFGGYVEAEVYTELLGQPLTANAGLRVVTTDVASKGFARDANGVLIPTSFAQDYTEYLPSVNLAWEFYEDVLLRLNMSRNMTRPGLSTLSGAVSVTPINGNVSIGNPDLEPIRANAIDLGVEWYFADESFLSLTLFHKDIESFITGDILELQPLPANIQAIVAALPEYDPSSPLYNPSLLAPDSSDWNIATSVNGEGAALDGYELGYQHALDFLIPGVGVYANFTHVESEAVFGNGVVGSLEGLSENSYNAGVYYENDTFGARLVMNSRDDYVTSQNGSNGNASENTTGPTRFDASAFWNITDNVTATLEVINLTNEKERLYTTGPVGDLNLVREYNATGTEVIFGIRATF